MSGAAGLRVTRRGLAAAALGLAMLGLSGVPATAAPGAASIAAASTADQPGSSAVTDYGTCLQARGSGDLLLLVDASGSLKDTDPQGARVSAAKYLLQQMASTSAQGGFQVDVAVSTFSSDFSGAGPWTALDANGLPALLGQVEALAQADTGMETDYWSALEGARRALADRAQQQPEGTACQAIAWFSDGRLDLVPRTTSATRALAPQKPYAEGVDLRTEAGAAAAESAAADQLCRGGGLADQLRSGGVRLFAIGLSPDGSDGDFSLMRSIATGTAGPGGAACGAVRQPSPGEFVLARNIDDLLFAFGRFASPNREPLEHTSGVCQGQLCSEDRHTFVLDGSILSVHVLGSSDVDGATVYLVPPSGEPVALPHGSIGGATPLAIGTTALKVTWQSARTVTVDMAAGDVWTGQWSLAFVDPGKASPDGVSRSQIHITGDLFPTWEPPEGPLHVGESVDGTRLGLADASGTSVAANSLLGDVRLDVSLVGADGTVYPLATGLTKAQIGQPFALDLTKAPVGPASVRLELHVTTAAATAGDGTAVPGTELTPQRVDVPVTLAPPPDFPTVGSHVDFGTVEGAVDTQTSLPVTGTGCVWLDPTSLSVTGFPSSVGNVAVTADAADAATCQQVGTGQAGELPLRLTTQGAGNGAVTGTVRVFVAPQGEPNRAIAVPVTLHAEVRKPLSQPRFWLGLVLALVLGPGLPLAQLWVLKASGARIPARPLYAKQVPVTVDGGQLLRDGAPFALRDGDFSALVPVPAGGGRRIQVDGGVTLETHVGRSPFGAASVAVRAPGRIGASSAVPGPRGADLHAQLPLAVHNTWVLLVDPAREDDGVSVLLLVGADTGAERRAALVEDMTQRVPNALARLRDAGRGTPGAATQSRRADEPFGGAGVTQAGAPFGGQGSLDTFGSAPSADPFGSSSGASVFGASAVAGSPGPAPGGPIDDGDMGNPFGAGPEDPFGPFDHSGGAR